MYVFRFWLYKELWDGFEFQRDLLLQFLQQKIVLWSLKDFGTPKLFSWTKNFWNIRMDYLII